MPLQSDSTVVREDENVWSSTDARNFLRKKRVERRNFLYEIDYEALEMLTRQTQGSNPEFFLLRFLFQIWDFLVTMRTTRSKRVTLSHQANTDWESQTLPGELWDRIGEFLVSQENSSHSKLLLRCVCRHWQHAMDETARFEFRFNGGTAKDMVILTKLKQVVFVEKQFLVDRQSPAFHSVIDELYLFFKALQAPALLHLRLIWKSLPEEVREEDEDDELEYVLSPYFSPKQTYEFMAKLAKSLSLCRVTEFIFESTLISPAIMLILPNTMVLHIENCQYLRQIDLVNATPNARKLASEHHSKLQNLTLRNCISLEARRLVPLIKASHTGLSSVSLGGRGFIIDTCMETILRLSPSLNHLRVSRSRSMFSKSVVEFQCYRHLVHLVLEGCHGLEDDALDTFLCYCPLLEELHLIDCENLRLLRLTHLRLRELKLKCCDNVEAISSDLPALEGLEMRVLALLSRASLEQFLTSLPKLKTLLLKQVEVLPFLCLAKSSLEKLTLKSSPMPFNPRRSCDNMVSKAIRDCPGLKTGVFYNLHLSRPKFRSQSIQVLEFANIEYLCDAFVKQVSQDCPNLQVLSFASCPTLETPVIRMKNLIKLSFTSCHQLQDQTFLYPLLLANPNLHYLHVADCRKLKRWPTQTFRTRAQLLYYHANIRTLGAP